MVGEGAEVPVEVAAGVEEGVGVVVGGCGVVGVGSGEVCCLVN